MHHHVVHDVEARGATEDDALGAHAQHVCHEAAGGGHAVGATIVARVDTIVDELGGGVEHVKHGAGEVNLLRAWLAAGHVELEPARPELLDLALKLGNLVIELLGGHALVDAGHGSSSC